MFRCGQQLSDCSGISKPVSISDDEESLSSFRGFSCLSSSNKPDGMARQLNIKRIANEDYEALLNEGMKQLSFDQIQQEQELLHGVADETDLSQGTINVLLSCLQKSLDKRKAGTAYETAEQRNKSYAQNKEFQMAFLRANRFDTEESAEKIINFFRYKQDLFGDECLVRDITSQDLDEDDLEFLLTGYLQYSLLRDQSGRKIFLQFPGLRSKTSIATELRARFYLLADSLSTMVDLSRGCTIVTYLVDQYDDHLNGHGILAAATLFNTGVPLKQTGIHACYSNPISCLVVKAGIAMMPYRERAKTRIHLGSHVECQYLLASFGITKGALPLTGLDSEMDLSYHHAWFQGKVEQENRDQQGSVPASIQKEMEAPTLSSGNENDVLCIGRAVKGVGNERLQSLAHLYYMAFENASAGNRRLIINGIIDEMYRQGGRFLKPDTKSGKVEENCSWKELSPEERRTKIAQLFRNMRSRRMRAGNGSVSAFPGMTRVQPSSVPVFIEDVRPEDVLFGQHVDNPGNRYLREIILDVTEEYNHVGRGGKKEIVLSLVQKIHERGGRFLKKAADGSRWEIASNQAARQRISKQFRNFRRKR